MRRPSPVPGLEAIPTCQTGIILFPVWRYESGRIPGLPVPVRCRSGLFVPVCQHASSSPLRCAHVPVLSPHSASPLNSLSSTAPLRTIPPYSAQSSPARHHSVTFRAAHHSADSTPSPLFPPRLSCRDPTLRRPNLPCNLPHVPATPRPQDSTPFNALSFNENRRYRTILPWSI